MHLACIALPALSAPEDCWKPPLTLLPCPAIHPPSGPACSHTDIPSYHLTTLHYIHHHPLHTGHPCDTLHAAPSQRPQHLTAPPRRPVITSAATRDPCPQLDNGSSQCALAQGNIGARACHMQAARRCSVALLPSPASLDKARCGTTARTRHAPAQQQLSRHCLP